MSTSLSVSMVHIRVNGESHTIPITDLDVGDRSSNSEILAAVARHLNVPESSIANQMIDREGQNITIRPNASFG